MELSQELSENLRSVAQMAGLSRDMIWVAAMPSNQLLYASREQFAAHGFTPEALLCPEQQVLRPQDGAYNSLADYYGSLAAAPDHQVATAQFRARNANGEGPLLLIKARVFERRPDGSVSSVLCVAHAASVDEKYRLLMESMDEALALCEAVRDDGGRMTDYRWLDVNSAQERLTGLSRTELVGRLHSTLPLRPDQELMQLYEQALDTGKALRTERPAPDPREGWFSLTVLPLGNGRFASLTYNITDQKNAEQALRESERRLQRAVSTAKTVVWSWNVEENKIDTTSNFKDVYGLTAIEFAEEGFSLLHPDDRDAHLQKVQRAASVGGGYYSQFRIVKPGSGEIVWLQERADSVLNAQGQVARVIGASIDITDLKQAEDAMRLSEEKFRILFNSMDEGYCIIQMLYDDGGALCDWRFLEVNPAFERHNGLENAAGKTIRELVPGIEEKWIDIYGRVAETGESVRFEEDSEALGRMFDLYAFRIGDPEERKVAVLFIDITRRKQDEAALRESEGWLNGQKEAFQAAMSGQPLPVSLEVLSRMVSAQTACEASTVFYMMAAAGLQPLAGVQGNCNAASFEDGPCPETQAMRTGTHVIISDVEADPLWEPWQPQAKVMGCRAGWFFPVQAMEGPVLGVFAMYFGQPRKPTARELELVGLVTHAAAIIMSRDTQLVERSQAERALRELNQHLEQRAERRTREIMSLKMRQEKEKLNAVIFAQEQERTRIGEGLHNGVAQLLYAVQSRLQLVQASRESDVKHLAASIQILSEAIQDTRGISFELMPPVLKDFGLATALDTLLRRIFSGEVKFKVSVGLQERLPEDLEISIYRIVQEAINNILKHADATEAAIDISLSKKAVRIRISDNGAGFSLNDSVKRHKGIGLQTIGNRVKLLNGKLRLRSSPGQGTHIHISIPLLQ